MSSPFDQLSVQLNLPDLWQQQAVRALNDGRDVIVDAPTGAGKTLVFELFAKAAKLGRQAVYTVPTRALANDKFAAWKRDGWGVGIATGDVAENTTAPVLVATLETQIERLVRRASPPSLLVVDEYQLIADRSRGLSYELAIALADPAQTQLLLLSGSVANPDDLATWLPRLGRDPEVVETADRPVPLREADASMLPFRAPKSVTGFWQRTAAEVLMADMAPLLIFAPQRSAAEKLAKRIAAALPAPNPLQLTGEQSRACGKDLSKLLARRVAFHHSGLPYAARAGVVEPLARAGQLAVIVATTGLAAGINFSVRSTLVADTRYTDAYGTERQLAPDELLQMFGRAGRRGLDEIGYLVVTKNSPLLSDAGKKTLRRCNEIDWPTLVREMGRAAGDGEPPFDAARALCTALFSEQQVHLGVQDGGRPSAPATAAPAARATADASTGEDLFNLGPVREEVFSSKGQWEPFDPDKHADVDLELATLYFRNYLEPALTVSHFVADTFPNGRLCKIKHPDGFHYYGKEIAVAVKRDDGRFALTRTVRKHLRRNADEYFTYDQLEDRVLTLLENDFFMGGRICDISVRNGLFAVQLDFRHTRYPAYLDSAGVYLIEAERRAVPVEKPTDVIDPSTASPSGDTAAPKLARRNSPVEAWRTLGLVDADGTPTPRGHVFSLFHGGEGLAVAAALEDDGYDLDELALHLANLRAGRRFESFVPDPSEQLATTCRAAYGGLTYDGYLEVGLPPDYGIGAAEAVAATIAARGKTAHLANDDLGAGDIERAFVEWLSLLRHIANAPPLDGVPRWAELQKTAAATLAKHAAHSPTGHLPPVPAAQLANTPRHKLYPNHFRGV